MQPTVQLVFVVVASVIGGLLTLGLTGILTLLSLDRDAPARHAAPATAVVDEEGSSTLRAAA
jgi:hypothetical protein